jgi:hypothetical protein
MRTAPRGNQPIKDLLHSGGPGIQQRLGSPLPEGIRPGIEPISPGIEEDAAEEWLSSCVGEAGSAGREGGERPQREVQGPGHPLGRGGTHPHPREGSGARPHHDPRQIPPGNGRFLQELKDPGHKEGSVLLLGPEHPRCQHLEGAEGGSQPGHGRRALLTGRIQSKDQSAREVIRAGERGDAPAI